MTTGWFSWFNTYLGFFSASNLCRCSYVRSHGLQHENKSWDEEKCNNLWHLFQNMVIGKKMTHT